MSHDEIWNSIYESSGYEVSSLGRIRRIKDGECKYFKTSRPSSVYDRVDIVVNGKRVTRPVHNLVLEAFIGPRPKGLHGAHLNGDCRDNRLVNLAWVTPKENNAHKILHGTHQIGEKNPNCRLKNEDVMAIRVLSFCGLRNFVIAEMFDEGYEMISAIVKHKKWSHLPKAEDFLKSKLAGSND